MAWFCLGVGLCALLPSAGCILPLQFDEKTDAGVDNNYPPVIIAADPVMPGFFPLQGTPIDVTIDVKDKDLVDDIHVRVFRDYDPEAPLPPFVDTRVLGPSPGAVREVVMTTANWCNGAGAATTHTFTVLVADRAFLLDTSVAPAYQALPEGAESSRMFWIATCQ